jgi:hypothetical protein
MCVAEGIAVIHPFAEDWAKLTNGDQLPNQRSPLKRAQYGGRMLKTWRRTALVALAAGAAVAVQLTAVVPAQAAAGPAITIAATSKLRVVSNDVFVVYKAGTYAIAMIHGTITNADGDVATLYAQQFPFKKAPVQVGNSMTIKAAKWRYSWTVTPTLLTKYAVRLTASGKKVATSRVQNVYVVSNEEYSAWQKCSRPVCHETLRIYTYVPDSALGFEMAKHVYPYFGISLSRTGTPKPPAWYYLNDGHPSVTKARRISATEFENTLTLSFTIGNDGFSFDGFTCTRDNVSKDGIGLPGYHDCGASRIPASIYYLG